MRREITFNEQFYIAWV